MFSFKASIYKVGINPCVKVPYSVSKKLTSKKGYIPVEGTINGFFFKQTLVPVKNEQYRLYVNGIMLKGSGSKVGDRIGVQIKLDKDPQKKDPVMPAAFKKALEQNQLTGIYESLIPSRQKEILRYLENLKTEEARQRNILKVIGQLSRIKTDTLST